MPHFAHFPCPGENDPYVKSDISITGVILNPTINLTKSICRQSFLGSVELTMLEYSCFETIVRIKLFGMRKRKRESSQFQMKSICYVKTSLEKQSDSHLSM